MLPFIKPHGDRFHADWFNSSEDRSVSRGKHLQWSQVVWVTSKGWSQTGLDKTRRVTAERASWALQGFRGSLVCLPYVWISRRVLLSTNEEFLLNVKGELRKYAPGKFRAFGNLCPAGTGSEGFWRAERPLWLKEIGWTQGRECAECFCSVQPAPCSISPWFHGEGQGAGYFSCVFTDQCNSLHRSAHRNQPLVTSVCKSSFISIVTLLQESHIR